MEEIQNLCSQQSFPADKLIRYGYLYFLKAINTAQALPHFSFSVIIFAAEAMALDSVSSSISRKLQTSDVFKRAKFHIIFFGIYIFLPLFYTSYADKKRYFPCQGFRFPKSPSPPGPNQLLPSGSSHNLDSPGLWRSCSSPVNYKTSRKSPLRKGSRGIYETGSVKDHSMLSGSSLWSEH